MNSKQKQYTDMKYEEGLQSIRSRLTQLSTSRKNNKEDDE